MLETEDLWEESLFVALPTGHSLASRPELSGEDIATLPLHLRSRAGESSFFRHLFAPLALDCEEHDVSGEALLDLVSIGMGATIIAKSGRVERKGIVYCPVAGPHRTFAFRAVWPRDDRNPLRHRLLSLIRNHVRRAQS
jgi:LysR family hydrogen peroxide-inducible transcriptional activator